MAEKLGVSAEMLTLITSYALKVLGVLALLFGAWIVAGWAKRTSFKAFNRAKLDATLAKFFSNMTKYLILTVAVISCLGIFGIQTTSFAAVLAAAGFAIGMGFQNSLSNFSSGVMLLIFRPFGVGQFVSIAGATGTVNAIELFTTSLDTTDNRRLVIPNSTIFNSTIENFSHHPIRRIDVPVGTDYSADLDEVREALTEVATANPDQPKDKPPQVVLLSLGDSAIAWELRVWTSSENFLKNKEKLIYNTKNALDKRKIGIPFPQMSLHFETPLERVSKDRSTSEASTSVN